MRATVHAIALSATVFGFAACAPSQDQGPPPWTQDAAHLDGGEDAGNGAGFEASWAGAAGTGASRLVPWQVEAEGTAPLVQGIYDRQEQVHCRFLLDEAGQLRCLPWGLPALAETTSFSDAACAKRVYQTDPAQEQLVEGRPTALPLPRVDCAPKRYAVGVLSPLPAGASLYGGTPCAPLAAPKLADNLAAMTVDSVQPPDRWATGGEVDGPLLYGRIRVRQVQTDDGALFTDHLIDEHWSQPCRVAGDVGNTFYCQPDAIFDSVGNEGAQCMGERVWRAHACDRPVYIRDDLEKRAIGPVWKGPISWGGHGCSLVPETSTPDGPDITYQEGGPLEASAIMPSQPWATGGTGRLRLRGLVDAAGGLVPLPAWILWRSDLVLRGDVSRYFDAIAGSSCNPVRTPDGTLRCVPTTVDVALDDYSYVVGYADAQCSERVYFCPDYEPSCPSFLHMGVRAEASGDIVTTSFTDTREVTTLYMLIGGACTGAVETPGLYALGAALTSWDQFPALSEINGRAPSAP